MHYEFEVLGVRDKLSTYTVGMYSPGKALVVYEIKRQVYGWCQLIYSTHFQ